MFGDKNNKLSTLSIVNNELSIGQNSGRKNLGSLHVPLLLGFTVGLGLLSLSATISQNTQLIQFGQFSHLVQPMAAVSFIAISLALLAPASRKFPAWPFLLAVPVIAICSTLIQQVSGLSTHINGGVSMSGIPIGQSMFLGRLRGFNLASLTMLTVSVAMVRHKGRAFSRIGAALASVTLGVSSISVLVILLGLAPTDEQLLAGMPSLLSAGQAVFICIAVLAGVQWPNLPDIPGRGKKLTPILRSAIPIIVFVPALTGLTEILADKAGLASPLAIDIIAAGVNVAIFAMLVVWSITRFVAEHPAMWETANAMETAPIALTSLNGEIFHWSRGCEELYGWAAEEVIGRQITEVLHLDDEDAYVSSEISATQENQREVIVQRKNATTVHIIERVRVVEAEGRAPVRVYKMTDISARVQMEAALKESEANLLLALDARQIGTFEWNVRTRHVTMSAGMEQRLGLQTGDLGDILAWARRIKPLDLKAIIATINRCVGRRDERFDFHYHIKVQNGGVRLLEGSGQALYDKEGALTKVIGVHIDATDRNEREAALLAEQEQFRLVLKTVPSAMVIFDETGVIKAFSVSAESLFGFATTDAIGRNVGILSIDTKAGKVNPFADRHQVGASADAPDGAPVSYARRQDGKDVPVELWMGDMQIGTKRLFAGFARDLTDRLASEGRLSRMHDELLHASRLSTMGEMAAGLAHELNQPLAATVYFLGAADLLLAANTSAGQARELARLGTEQALRAGEIVRRMRDFATRESIDMQVVKISQIIEDAVSLAFLGDTRYGIQLVCDLDPSVESILADRVQIVQVLVNLLRNASEELRKCSPVGRTVTIRTKSLGSEMIEVSVADSGPGLASPMLANVYMPFMSTKREGGLGLGLSICRRIIEAHGGMLTAANGPGGGAVFCFTLGLLASQERLVHDDT